MALAFCAATPMDGMADGERNPIFVVLENVRSLFNVGAVLRTADAVAAARVYLTGFTGTPPRKEINRVALGAEQFVPWEYAASTLEVIESLRAGGIQVLALEQAEGSVDYRAFAYTPPVAVVLGHEVEGVRRETTAACDGVIHLPMLGQKASLNVSVAAGVVLYRILETVERGREEL